MTSCSFPAFTIPPPVFSTFSADDLCEIAHRQAGIAQLFDFWINDDLLDIAAIGVDLRDPLNSPQLRLDDVFLDFPQFHQLRLASWRGVGASDA